MRGMVVGIIQARMGSQRLPGKIMYPLAQTTVLSVLSQRIRCKCECVNEWWLATSNHPSDDITAMWGDAVGLKVFRGSESDVLSRFVSIAQNTTADWIVRVTADDPLMHGSTIDLLLATAEDRGADYVGPNPAHYPVGFVPELISRGALLTTEIETASRPEDREHVTSWWRKNRPAVQLPDFSTPARPAWSWTVDTPEDFQRLKAAFCLLGAEWRAADYLRLVTLFDAHAELMTRAGG